MIRKEGKRESRGELDSLPRTAPNSTSGSDSTHGARLRTNPDTSGKDLNSVSSARTRGAARNDFFRQWYRDRFLKTEDVLLHL